MNKVFLLSLVAMMALPAKSNDYVLAENDASSTLNARPESQNSEESLDVVMEKVRKDLESKGWVFDENGKVVSRPPNPEVEAKKLEIERLQKIIDFQNDFIDRLKAQNERLIRENADLATQKLKPKSSKVTSFFKGAGATTLDMLSSLSLGSAYAYSSPDFTQSQSSYGQNFTPTNYQPFKHYQPTNMTVWPGSTFGSYTGNTVIYGQSGGSFHSYTITPPMSFGSFTGSSSIYGY